MSGNQSEMDNAIGYMMIISKAHFTTIYKKLQMPRWTK